MRTVTSKDGTTIAYDQSGKGPSVILVDGALQYRAFDQGMAELAGLLAQHFTVIHYLTKRADLRLYTASLLAQCLQWKQQ